MVSACVSTYGWHTLTGWCLYQAVDAADRVLLEARFRASRCGQLASADLRRRGQVRCVGGGT